jgi:acyl-CoA reductase-like NAD-dependent aldehyde dehydrogenase
VHTLEEIEKSIGTIPKGPVIGGEILTSATVTPVVDPATEQPLTEISFGSVDDAVRAVDAAEEAMPVWNELSPRYRSDVLRRAFELMTEHSDALARLIVLENGKSYADAAGEVAYVQGAIDQGAVAAVGGSAPVAVGYFYAPTVLTGVPQDASILSQEIFGPVAPVVAFDDIAEAVTLANNTEYGLVSYAYGGDLAQLLRVAEQLDSGMVGLNRPVVSDPAAPFGGTKQSGLGREGGHEGMLEFTESKYIAVQW